VSDAIHPADFDDIAANLRQCAIIPAPLIQCRAKSNALVIPGRANGSAQSAARWGEPGIQRHRTVSGFRVRAKTRAPE
jgi:hypothetical protein